MILILEAGMVGQFSLVILQWQWLFDMTINHDQPLIILGTLIRQSHFSKVGIPRRIFVILMEKNQVVVSHFGCLVVDLVESPAAEVRM